MRRLDVRVVPLHKRFAGRLLLVPVCCARYRPVKMETCQESIGAASVVVAG